MGIKAICTGIRFCERQERSRDRKADKHATFYHTFLEHLRKLIDTYGDEIAFGNGRSKEA